jgi:hypothetical protein
MKPGSVLCCRAGIGVKAVEGLATNAPMYWFRTNVRCGAGLALVALAIQIALSLVHAHFGVPTQPLGRLALVAQAAQAPAALPSAPAPDPNSSDPKSPDPKSNGAADSYCPACALLHLAGMWLPPAPPALEPPRFAGRINLEPGIEFGLAASPHRFFRARAPPLA